MPELPEAETIVRGLRTPLEGRRVLRVEILRPDLLATAEGDFRTRLRGRRLLRVGRRGKNVVLEVEGRAGPPEEHSLRLVINLGMSGRLLLRGAGDPAPPSTHPGVHLELEDGSLLVYDDARRFGRLSLLSESAFRTWSATLGPEPLHEGFSVEGLARGLTHAASPVRSWLLDQRKVAGVGNIYANEALFLAGIDPRTPARDLDPESVQGLHTALRQVLDEAIQSGGSTLRDYRTAQGWIGSYQHRLRVYGRVGLPCPTCGTPVERVVFGGRSAFLCPCCQPERR